MRSGALIRFNRYGTRHVAAVTALAVAGPLMFVPPAQAAGAGHGPVDHDRVVKGHTIKPTPRKRDASIAHPAPAAKVAWPEPGTAEATVPVAGNRPTASRVGRTPVWVSAPSRTSAERSPASGTVAGKVRVRIIDQRTAQRSGVDGLLFTIGRADTVAGADGAAAPKAGKVGVRLDYSGFAQAFGGSFGARLRLVRLPACVLTMPDSAGCRTASPIATANNTETKSLSADIEAAPVTGTSGASASPSASSSGTPTANGGQATVLAAVAGAASDKGDYKATSLSPSAAWQVSPQSGDFTWSYSLRTPPVPGGLEPELALGYSSSSIDGRTSNTNGQPSWVGDGFDLWPGYIQRTYKACSDDGVPKDPIYGTSPGDQCWGYDNAVLSLGGRGGELIPVSGNKWKLKNDDGTRVEHLTGTDGNTGNGDNDNEYWKVTTSDGTQYFFGKNRWTNWTSGNPETKSAWTSPVFGNNSTEPCHNDAGFKDSWCQQGFRWNLDFVVDTNDNAVAYYYGTETNHYARNLKAADETPYVRGGYLSRVEYGVRKTNMYPAKAPARVDFDVSERCIRDTASDCAESNIKDHPDYWPDVPWDLNCDAGKDCEYPQGSTSPTFWSRKRLTKITTSVIKADGSGYRPVDSWALKHAWGMADIDRQLLLESITQTGEAGTEPVATPPVSFVYKQLRNRVDKLGDNLGPFVKDRLTTVYNETGGMLDVNYTPEDCTTSDEPSPADNHRRCFPVYWENGTNADKPALDWFHKYAVAQTVQTDLTGKSPDIVTDYDYSIGQPAWHFDDDDGLTPEKYKTWSQWRGFSKARVTVRNPGGTATQTDHWYAQGMDGDRAATVGDGKKNVTISTGEPGDDPIPDHESIQGFEVRTVSYTAPGGAVAAKGVSIPWHHQTASRTRSWGTVTANLTGAKTTRAFTALDGGTWQETKATTNTFDTTTGAPLEVDDFGDVTKNDDDRCTTTDYVTNDTAWILNTPSHVRTVARKCADTPDLSNDLIADERTSYDSGAFGAAPSRGNATLTEKAKSATSGTITYITAAASTFDGYGRTVTATDPAGNSLTTGYTETQGLTTKVTSASPPSNPQDPASALTTARTFDTAWGNPLTETDPGGKTTTYSYDALGRVAKVWGPNRSTSQVPADREYEYTISKNAIVAVTTKRLNNTNGQDISYELLDGWLRPRQTQTQGLDGGRLIADTFYNAQGQVNRVYDTYYAAGAPTGTLFGVDVAGEVETQNVFEYDGLGRTTAEKLLVGNSDAQEKWRTTYSYGGNRTTVTPPEGALPVTTITDARGRVTELRQDRGTGPGDYATTTYEYTPAGQPAKVTEPSGHTWTSRYDLRGRKIETTDPDTGLTKFTYDDLDQLLQVEDARGKKVGYTYDGVGRKTGLYDQTSTAPGTKLADWTYDTVRKGLPATSTRYDGSATYTQKIKFYDNLNRPTSTTVTLSGLPSPESSLAPANGYTFTTTYNNDGTVKTTGMPATGGLPAETIGYNYDDLGRSTSTKSNLSSYVLGTDYTKTGKLIGQQLATSPTGKKTSLSYTYEPGTQRLATATTLHDGQAGIDSSATYSYHDAGNIKQITDVSRTGTDNQCFRYDAFQRLTDAWAQGGGPCATDPAQATLGGPAPYRANYTYDETGNRKSETTYSGANQVTSARSYTYANGPGVDPQYKGHQLATLTQTGQGAHTETYGYDAVGNTTSRTTATGQQTLTWNVEGDLTQVTDTTNGATTYAYDADGGRLLRRDPTGTTLYLPGTEIHLDQGSTTPKATRYYTHDGDVIAMRDAAGVTFLAGDHHNTTELAINAADGTLTQRRFTPFGQERGTSQGIWPNDKGFLGGTTDTATDLTNLGARQYDPATGRFISVDPLIDSSDPQQMNGYTYADNNPVTHADPSGLCPPDICGNGVINVGHKNPATTGGCGHDCGKPGIAPGMGPGGYGPGSGGGHHFWKPVKKLLHHGWNFYVGTQITAPTPLAPLFAFPSIERTTAGLLGADTDSKSYFWGKLAPDIAMTLIDGVGAAKGAFTLIRAIREGEIALSLPKIISKLKPKGAAGAAENGGSAALAKAGGRTTRAASEGDGAAAAAGRGKGCSFPAGTAVLLADGTTKAIEKVKAGDKVLATDPVTGVTEPRPVLQVIIGADTKSFVQITVRNADKSQAKTKKKTDSGVVVATDNHPFWVVGQNQWVDAGQLKVGMWLRTSAGTHVQIAAIKTWRQYQQVYNFDIAAAHTFYVGGGNTPILVHNEAGCANKLRRALNAAGDIEPSDPHSPHHIVAGNSQKAVPARAQLKKLGIGINDAENGVWLPRSSSSPNPNGLSVHSKIHTDEYYKYVNYLMSGARTRDEALDVIDHVRRQLVGGYWP